ncbi:MAG: sugar phosphate isomerase/epimerase, partial [Clostridiales bacterium]
FPDNPNETKQLNPELARKKGLHIENIHTPFLGVNEFWIDNLDGEEYLKQQMICIDDCKNHEIQIMVLHINQGLIPPPISKVGLERLNKLIDKAENENVYLAFENMRNLEHLQYIFYKIQSEKTKFCYDSGHHNCKTSSEDLLTEFSDKLIAINLHDNNGLDDEHKLPFDGTIDWNSTIQSLKKSNYTDAMCLEVIGSSYPNLSPFEFLHVAYQRAEGLLDIKESLK